MTTPFPEVRLKTFLEIDWAFVMGLIVSFVAILFTYDAVCGEREDGTLRLMLSGSVPRDGVLLGKFIGAFLSVSAPIVLGAILSLRGEDCFATRHDSRFYQKKN